MHWLPDTFLHLFHPRRSNNHRPRVLHPEAFLAFSFLAIAFTVILAQPATKMLLSQAGQVLGSSSSITAPDVVVRTNEERKKAGLTELQTNTLLNEAALAKAQHMLANQYWAHIAPDGTDPWTFFKHVQYRYSVAGENLARDFAQPEDLMQAWMTSPTHRANVLSSKYKEIGVAVVDGELLGTDTTLVVQLFGTSQTTTGQVPQQEKAAIAPVPAPTIAPAVPNEQVAVVEAAPVAVAQAALSTPQVLGGTLLPLTLLTPPPLFSPLQLMKMFFLAMIMVIVITLTYDAAIMNSRVGMRLVGKNIAHIMLFLFVAYLLIFFKGGVIG